MTAESKKTPTPENVAADRWHSYEDGLSRETLLLHSLMDQFSDRIYFKDVQSRIIYGSRSYIELFHRKDISEICGKTDFDFFSEYHAKAAFRDEQEIIRTGKAKLNIEEMETWPDGGITWVSTSKAPLRDEQGNVVGVLGISRDITERKQAQEALLESEARYRQVSEELALVNRQLAEANLALQELSLTDPLTGLRNRRFLTTHMPQDVAQVERSHRNVTENALERMKHNVDMLFLMLDLDHFKMVNDRYGHWAGDLVLQQVGKILRRVARGTDTIARVGGEEFLIVARQTARADSHILAERIRASIEAHPFHLGNKETVRCTCSVGFSVYPLLLQEISFFTWEQILEIADHCLYAAKYSGRNAWVGIIPDQHTLKMKSRDLPKDLSELVRTGLLPMISSLKTPVTWTLNGQEAKGA